MTELLIRPIHYPDEYPQVYDLWSRAGHGIHLRRSDDPDEMDKKVARDPDLFLVALLDGRIVGAVLGGFDGRRGMIYHLAVEPSLRGRGIGDQLMRAVEDKLREKGCIRSYLLVTTDNREAIDFYEKRGWERMDFVYTYGKNLT